MKQYLLVVFILLLLSGCSTSPTGNVNVESQDAQVVMLGLQGGRYTPNEITVEAGKPVTLKNDGSLGGCGMYVIQKDLGINANFANNAEYTFTPEKKGTYTFSCSMGMYKGILNVV